jgi:hypothetical protein
LGLVQFQMYSCSPFSLVKINKHFLKDFELEKNEK